MGQEVAAFQRMVERALAYRDGTIALAERLRGKMRQQLAFSGHDLADLKQSEATHLALREELFRVAAAHECWLDSDQVDGVHIRLAPALRLKGLMLSLSAALVLYDNYLLAMSLYQESSKLRRHLNNKDVGYGLDYGELNRSTLSFASARNRRRVNQGLAYYAREIVTFRGQLTRDETLRYLNLVITQSPSYNMTKRNSFLFFLGTKLEFFGLLTEDSLLRLRDEGINLLSMVFGDMVGLVESRRGKLHGKQEVLADLEGALQAGDILLEKTPFRLTNVFIPGHWGHSAIWIGTEKELRALGIWNHPLVSRHHTEIRQNRLVAEALRFGVKMNTLRHFLNVDDVAVLRHRRLSPTERSETIVQALRQVGKRYDFNFDVETTDRIVCSELVYNAYTATDWPTKKFLGRATISPDDIAARALDDGPFFVVRLYHDGGKIADDLSYQMARLLTFRRGPRVQGASRESPP